MTHILPVCNLAELREEIADTDRALDRLLLARSVSSDAEVRRWESVQGRREYLARLREQESAMAQSGKPDERATGDTDAG